MSRLTDAARAMRVSEGVHLWLDTCHSIEQFLTSLNGCQNPKWESGMQYGTHGQSRNGWLLTVPMSRLLPSEKVKPFTTSTQQAMLKKP
ncbi:MAG: hypothetical protein WA826_13425 [Silvibacterium sp.]